ncbi:hypothetical protein FPV67DRAFT_568095 [Lyophyllum atratum]|nr:hypothetical protein FPV67DRAFT_568095 [Lyophyllum atratum]
MLGRTLLLGAIVGSGWASDHKSTELRTRRVYDINYRQVDAPMLDVPQPPRPTTSINSGPHPAPGAPGSIIVSPPAPPTTSTPLLLITVGSPSQNPLALSTTSLIIASIPLTTTSSLLTDGIISITALPPLDPTDVPTAVTYPKKTPESERKFKLIYLAPAFVVLGILLGSLTAWFGYGCMTRRPKVRDGDALIGGPRYVPPASGEGDLEGGVGGPLLRDDMHEEVFSWPNLNERAGMENEKYREGDAFLALPSPSKSRSTRTKSTRSTTTAHSDATYVLDTDEDGEGKKLEDVPWESLRHKSIKRGILEEVQREGNRIDSLRPATGTLLRNTGTGHQKAGETIERRPPRHGRTDSDHLIGDIDLLFPDRASLRSRETNTDSSTRPSSHRADSTQTTLSMDSSITAGDKTQWRPGAGFRIVAESPLPSREPTPAPPEEASFGASWWGGSAHVDRYTPLPTRHTSRSRSASPVKPPVGPEPGSPYPRAHVLPQSPPQITSPVLENMLCFTPSPVRMPRTERRTPRKVRDGDGGRKQQRPPPSRSDLDRGINSPRPDMHHGRLVKSPPKARRPPMVSNASSSSAGSYTRDAQGRAVNVALKKVDGIVERSWGTRELGEEGVRSLSPTGFGRRAGD